jgi:hypothetical protein
MAALALVDHNGRPFTDGEKVPTPSKVDTSEEPLWKIAQREAERQSTNPHQQR